MYTKCVCKKGSESDCVFVREINKKKLRLYESDPVCVYPQVRVPKKECVLIRKWVRVRERETGKYEGKESGCERE